jgi:hypothetical protein
MGGHQCLEKPAMVWHAKMKQLMGDNKILKVRGLLIQIDRDRDGSGG